MVLVLPAINSPCSHDSNQVIYLFNPPINLTLHEQNPPLRGSKEAELISMKENTCRSKLTHKWQSPALYALQLLMTLYFSIHLNPTRAQDDGGEYFFCLGKANYTAGSTFEQNLNATLASLAANASASGFYTATVGQNDMVYGLVQCRADSSKDACQTCVDTAAKAVNQVCPYNKEAVIGYSDCVLRYSDWRFFATSRSTPIYVYWNLQNVTNAVVFNRQLGNLLRNITYDASSNPLKYDAGSISSSDFDNIYGLVQCTRDLAESSCFSCLESIISAIPQCCDQARGARIYAPSCALRYEVYRFFLLSPPPAGAPSPAGIPPNATPNANTVSSGSHGGKGTSKTIIAVSIPVAAASGLMLVIIGCLFWGNAKRKIVGFVREEYDRNIESLVIRLDTLKAATRNFSDENQLGQGGFGPVYKGRLLDGQEIAVKRLSRSSGQGLEELKTEVVVVARLLHRNLVKLIGFCLEEEEKLLVYEYLPNGSLDKILFDQNRSIGLEWERRYKIIVGIARGLLYLHEDSQLRIIHRDLKASNVLLDEYMNPRISDFGLARLFGESQTQGNTDRIAGTYGYMAPEYAKNGRFSTKSDVYSFGILVLEIVTGRRNSNFRSSINLQSQAWQHWARGTALQLLDPTLDDRWPRDEVMKCIRIGLLCVQEAAADRPTMSEIIMMFSGYSITSRAPSRPAFFVTGGSFGSDSRREDVNTSPGGYNSRPDSIQHSVNEVTITELDAR